MPKATISLVMSVRPSVRTEQLDSYWTDYHKMLHLGSTCFENLSRKFKSLLKSDRNKGYFTWRKICVLDRISFNSS